jgi:iron complex transport system substrate-binding protein
MSRSSKISFRTTIFVLSFLGACVLALWLDRSLTVTRAPRKMEPRIVSMSPHTTDILVAMGASDLLVGVSDFCELPASMDLPKCGGLLNPNFERILAVRPSMIFLLGKMDRVARFAEENGIQAVPTHIETFSDLCEGIEHMGRLVHREEAAKTLRKNLEKRMSLLRDRAAKIPSYRTLLLLGREEGALKRMMAIGTLSFMSDMMETAGGKNIFADQERAYFQVSRESIKALQPEVIFELRSSRDRNEAERQAISKDWEIESSLPAVKKRRVIVIAREGVSVPGPQMVDLAEQFLSYFEKFAAEDRRK